MNGECLYDPVRKKLVHVTPEETVRQQVIQFLLKTMEVPADVILVEEPLANYGVDNRDRADLIINRYDENQKGLIPVCVVECKAPYVPLDTRARDQLGRYCSQLGCDYGMATNGNDMLCYRFNPETEIYEQIENLPGRYAGLLAGEGSSVVAGDAPKRLRHEEIPQHGCIYRGTEIGEGTPEKLMVPMINFLECLLDADHDLSCVKHKLFSITADLHVRLLSVGDASGGMYQGVYRSIEIDYKGDRVVVSLSVLPCGIQTIIVVAMERDGQHPHHALQLNVDRNLRVIGDKVTFFHDGRIAIGNRGSGKVTELRQLVAENCPEIVDEKLFNMGSLMDDHLWYLDDPDVALVVNNLIAYALIRDEYRHIKKLCYTSPKRWTRNESISNR